MNAEELRRIKAIFDKALERPADERTEYVKQACGGDSHLETQVNHFLQLSGQHHQFLDSTLPELLSVPVVPEQVASELEPGTILSGRYIIDDVVKRSRHSTVYRAKDKRLFGKPVIIKLAHIAD